MPDRPSWIDDTPALPPRYDARRGYAARSPALRRDEPADHHPGRLVENRDRLSARWREFLGTLPVPRSIAAPKVVEEDRRDGVLRRRSGTSQSLAFRSKPTGSNRSRRIANPR